MNRRNFIARSIAFVGAAFSVKSAKAETLIAEDAQKDPNFSIVRHGEGDDFWLEHRPGQVLDEDFSLVNHFGFTAEDLRSMSYETRRKALKYIKDIDIDSHFEIVRKMDEIRKEVRK